MTFLTQVLFSADLSFFFYQMADAPVHRPVVCEGLAAGRHGGTPRLAGDRVSLLRVQVLLLRGAQPVLPSESSRPEGEHTARSLCQA